MTSIWVFSVYFFQLRCTYRHFIMKYWEKIFCRSTEAYLLILFAPAPSLKSRSVSISLNPQISPVRQVLYSFSRRKYVMRGTEQGSGRPKVNQ